MSNDAAFDKDDDELFKMPAFKSIGLDDILTWHEELPPFVVDGLVRAAAVTVFLVDPRVNVRYFALDLAMAAASGTAIEPFGPGAGVPTALYLPDGDPNTDSQSISGLFARIGAPPMRRRARANFNWCHGAAPGRTLPQLNTSSGQHAFMRSLPEDCKMVVLVNPGMFLVEAPDRLNTARLDGLLKKLTDRGIAVAVFETGVRPSSAASAYVSHHHDLIRLKLDVAAPVDFGEGFAVTRPKPLCGKQPSTLHVWYAERDGLIESGCDFGVEDREAMGKQVEMRERQERIARMMADREARGLPKLRQKTIADALGVDPATVTRDMQAMRSRWKRQEARRMTSAPRPKDET